MANTMKKLKKLARELRSTVDALYDEPNSPGRPGDEKKRTLAAVVGTIQLACFRSPDGWDADYQPDAEQFMETVYNALDDAGLAPPSGRGDALMGSLELTGRFVRPPGVSAAEADEAVARIAGLLGEVFPGADITISVVTPESIPSPDWRGDKDEDAPIVESDPV